MTLRVAQGVATSAALLTLLEVFVDEPMGGWLAASESAAVPWAAEASEGASVARFDAEVAVLHAQQRLTGGEATGGSRAARPPLSVESRVRQLIAQATSEQVLAVQPPAWRSWL